MRLVSTSTKGARNKATSLVLTIVTNKQKVIERRQTSMALSKAHNSRHQLQAIDRPTSFVRPLLDWGIPTALGTIVFVVGICPTRNSNRKLFLIALLSTYFDRLFHVPIFTII